MKNPKELQIVFMGTPEFATTILKKLVTTNHTVVACVTVPDKPAGRGRKLQESDVKKYATTVGIPVLQPEKLKDPEFISALKTYEADLFIVVAFRMLPKIVWELPPLGTFNLHGSLLPQYRGAAPINWAVMNGEKETGVTTFFINEEIDTGDILLQAKLPIGADETVGEVHDKMMHLGATVVVETVQQLANNTLTSQPQQHSGDLLPAPKLFKNDCKLDLNSSPEKAHNFIRGLSPYPTAWITLKNTQREEVKTLKIFRSKLTDEEIPSNNPQLIHQNKRLFIPLKQGTLELLEVQLEGKKRLPAKAFLAGFNVEEWEVGE